MATIKQAKSMRHGVAAGVALACASMATSAWGQFHVGNPNNAIEIGGQVDAAVIQTRNGVSGAPKTTGLNSGVGQASRWYLRGTEDLGGGLKAAFILDMGFDLDTGNMKSYNGNYAGATPTAPNGPAATGFNRRAVVGVYGNFGALWLGRDYTPIYWAGYNADTMHFGMFGNLQTLAAASGTGVERFARVSNGLFYRTPSMGGFIGAVTYSLGSESPGGAGLPPANANRFWGLGGDYRGRGALAGLRLSASYQELKYPLVAAGAFTGALEKRTDWLVGGVYDFKVAKVTAGYWSVKKPINSGADGNAEWVGLSVPIGAFTVLGQWHRVKQNNPTGDTKKADIYGLAGTYNFSKRTAAYVTYGKTHNNATAAFPLVNAEGSVVAGAAGASPAGLGIGLKTEF